MATFLTGKELNDAIYNIIWDASESLIIVSPFIKLDDYFKKLFEHHKNNHKLHIIVVFGKNEGSPEKSLRANDFEFFKQFKNITIVYCSNLHAKYYANEKAGVLTSINLYDASFKNNIEFGVQYNVTLLNSFTTNADSASWNYTIEMIEKHPAVFVKRPVYDKSILGSLLGQKSFVDSTILHDQTNLMLNNWNKWEKEPKKYIQDFPDEEKSFDKNEKRPERSEIIEEVKTRKESNYSSANSNTGYCIRTGVPISYNPKKPMCEDAYKSWSQYKNPDYPEKYCHKTGKKSNGKTSMRNPIL